MSKYNKGIRSYKRSINWNRYNNFYKIDVGGGRLDPKERCLFIQFESEDSPVVFTWYNKNILSRRGEYYGVMDKEGREYKGQLNWNNNMWLVGGSRRDELWIKKLEDFLLNSDNLLHKPR